jgi:hypothetical protein
MCWCFRGCWYVAISVAVARIYREDPPRVTTSQNQLGLSLSKRIRHRLVAKINSKRRLRVYEALGQILVDYSRAHRAPVPITSPRLAKPRPAPVRRGERACACVSPFLLSFTHLQVYRE